MTEKEKQEEIFDNLVRYDQEIREKFHDRIDPAAIEAFNGPTLLNLKNLEYACHFCGGGVYKGAHVYCSVYERVHWGFVNIGCCPIELRDILRMGKENWVTARLKDNDFLLRGYVMEAW